MKFLLHPIIALALVASLAVPALARTWTDTTGRQMEADILGVEGEKVLLRYKGKEIALGIEKLSEQDREFITQWQQQADKPAEDPAAAGDRMVLGTTLKPGGVVNSLTAPLSPGAVKAFSKADAKPTMLKLSIALPTNFNPESPQRVMWVSAAINNENERTAGNASVMGMYAPAATAAGWVVISADTDLGNPRLEDDQNAGDGDLEVHRQAIASLASAWPEFIRWEFACGGFSGGAKVSFYRVGHLLDSDLNVTGLFLAGCNQDMTEEARAATRFRKSDLRPIKVFISNGKTDEISSPQAAEKVRDSVEANGFSEVRLEEFTGGHEMKREQFENALTWFAEPTEK